MYNRMDLTALVVYGTLDGFFYEDIDGWLTHVETRFPANQTTCVR
jgi:hypothetical protein